MPNLNVRLQTLEEIRDWLSDRIIEIESAPAVQYPWTVETMRIINELSPDIKGKPFDPDWFLLRQRLEAFEDRVNATGKEPL